MKTENIWKQSFDVKSYHINTKGKASLTSICNYLQESAGGHATSAGFGYRDMMAIKKAWVLTRLKVIIDEYPLWNDTLEVNTWSKGPHGIYYNRDFELYNGKGEKFCRALSSWAAIDLRTRRPGLVEHLEDHISTIKDKNASDIPPKKLPAIKEVENSTSYQVKYSDLDLLMHVNNVKYIEWIVDSFPIRFLRKKEIRKLEVNYMAEAKYEDDLLINSQQIAENEYLISIQREEDEKEICRARIVAF